MKKILFLSGICIFLLCSDEIYAHCQMPCGIYHDEMVFDQIDQYVETMYKGITILNQSKFSSVREKNEFVRWVLLKDRCSDETAQTFLTYFLQQKIKPGETDTGKRLEKVHDLLFLLVQIKQNVDLKILENFAEKWEEFKLLFHVEGYECKIEQLKLKKRKEKEKEHEHSHDETDHDHPHDHEHEH